MTVAEACDFIALSDRVTPFLMTLSRTVGFGVGTAAVELLVTVK